VVAISEVISLFDLVCNFSGRVSHRRLTPRFAFCVNNSDYPASLELHKIYRLLPDDDAAQDGDVRAIDESGEDYLYPAEYFIPIAQVFSNRSQAIQAAVQEMVGRQSASVWHESAPSWDEAQEQKLADEGLPSEVAGCLEY
jgi:hypothetical protein